MDLRDIQGRYPVQPQIRIILLALGFLLFFLYGTTIFGWSCFIAVVVIFYVTKPKQPLYKVSKDNKLEYAYDDTQLQKVLENFGSGYSISRYKGLGEMNASQLWETTMDPNRRTLLQITIDDAELTNKAFEELMGDDVQKRREFIEANATAVANLDI